MEKDINDELMQRHGWQICFSKTHQKEYFFNTITGERSWERPELQSTDKGSYQDSDAIASHKRPSFDENQVVPTKRTYRSSEADTCLNIKVAVIVPYRDMHVEQRRKEHLDRFVPYITEFLEATGETFRIYIIEQSDDDRKFNRGKLLNIGFSEAKKHGAEVCVFHDVDLLPSPELARYYVTKPMDSYPVHVARVWDRYSGEYSRN